MVASKEKDHEILLLGNSGLEVSRIGLVTMPFGMLLDEKASRDVVNVSQDAGGNFGGTG